MLAPGVNLTVVLRHADGSEHRFEAKHTLSETQLEWFRHGSALNAMRARHGGA
jgi:aconitate hydratase